MTYTNNRRLCELSFPAHLLLCAAIVIDEHELSPGENKPDVSEWIILFEKASLDPFANLIEKERRKLNGQTDRMVKEASKQFISGNMNNLLITTFHWLNLLIDRGQIEIGNQSNFAKGWTLIAQYLETDLGPEIDNMHKSTTRNAAKLDKRLQDRGYYLPHKIKEAA